MNSLISEIERGIQEREKVLNNIFEIYKKETNKINKSQDELQIEIHFKGNKDKFRDDIITQFKGTNLSKVKVEEIANEFSDFIWIIGDYILDNSEKLRKIATNENIVQKIQDNIQKNYQELITKVYPDLVEIYYHDKLLENHSIGQRVSELILFILTQEDNYLIIIDQPEDDLDNQIIYEEVISTIKKKKVKIQFIFATYNANISVLGDAECIISAQYDDRINLDIGNIDYSTTHKKIIDIMGGGSEAFEKRKLIYTNWK